MTHRPGQNDQFFSTLKTARILATALSLGCLIFAGVAIYRRWNLPEEDPLISYVAAVLSIVSVVIRQLVLGYLEGASSTRDLKQASPSARFQNRSSGNEVVLDPNYQSYLVRVIVGLAILEGAIFIDLVAYLISGRWWSLLLAGLILLWMVSKFPTAGSLQRWVEDKRALGAFGTSEP